MIHVICGLEWLIMLSRPAYIVSEFCLIGFIYSSLITEELFSSPGAFVHCEIEVSSHCICITGNLRQNIIPNITQTPHRCCFIVSLLAQLSHAQSALFLFSLYCQTFNHKTTQEVLLNGLNLVFWNIFLFQFCLHWFGGGFPQRQNNTQWGGYYRSNS